MLPDISTWTESEIRDKIEEVKVAIPELLEKDDLRCAGWLHDYFCDIDGEHLEFDIEKPYEHVCPKCGAAYDEPRHHEAWVTQFRWQRRADFLAACALVRKDESLLEQIELFLNWLADIYRQFPAYKQQEGFHVTSKMMGTALDEAVTACNLTIGIMSVQDLISEDLFEKLKTGFLVPVYDFIIGYTSEISRSLHNWPSPPEAERQPHNIMTWFVSALACTAMALDDEVRLEYAIESPNGIRFQLENGPGERGLWLEGSIGYHYYTMGALAHFFTAAGYKGKTYNDLASFVKKMVKAPFYLEFSNGTSPVFSDTWAPAAISRKKQMFERWADMLGDPEIAEIPDKAYVKTEGIIDLPGFQMVKTGWGQWEIAVKYGHVTPSHCHPDTGSIIALVDGEEVMSDLGSTGYGSKMFKWNRSPMSHNTVVSDNMISDKDYFPEGVKKGSAVCKENRLTVTGTAGGCMLTRELEFADGEILDTITVTSDKELDFTWWMYVNSPFENLEGADAPEQFAQVEFIQDAKDVTGTEAFISEKVSIHLLNSGDDRLYTVVTPGNKVVDKRYGIAWYKRGKEAVFRAKWVPRGKVISDQ